MLNVLATQAQDPPAKQPPLGKVELDLEGAPFLEPREVDVAEAVAPKAPAAPQKKAEVKEVAPKSHKNLFILGAVLLLLVLIAAGAVYMFVFKEPAPAPLPGAEVVVVPSGAPDIAAAPTDKYIINWDPLWVQVTDPEGEIRFVYCKLALVTDNQRVALQLEQKKLVMRDAVYYYLLHKPYSILADLKQLDVLKSEIFEIINYYIIPETITLPNLEPGEAPPPNTPKERLKAVLLEEYLIK